MNPDCSNSSDSTTVPSELYSRPNVTLIMKTVDPPQVYAVIGAAIILVNSITFLVILTDRPLLRQSAQAAGIAWGNLLQGLHIFWVGVYRWTNSTTLSNVVTANSCLAFFFPLFYPLFTHTESVFLLIAGVERLLAINAPHWFRMYFCGRNSWIMGCLAFGMCLLAMLLGLVVALVNNGPTTLLCGASTVFGIHFAVYCNLFVTFGGTTSAVLTLIALVSGVFRIRHMPYLSGDAGRLRKQFQLTKSMSVVSVSEFGLVAIPSLITGLYLLDTTGTALPSFIRGSNSFYSNLAYSVITLLAFTYFNKAFRRAAIKVFHLGKVVEFFQKWQAGKTNGQVCPIQ